MMDFVFDIFEGGEISELKRAPGCRAGERDICDISVNVYL